MSPRDDNPAARATGLIGLVTRRTLATTGRLVLSGIGTGLTVLETSRRAADTTKRYAGTALQLASSTPLGRLLPAIDIDDDADQEAQRIAEAARPSRPTPVPDTPPKRAATETAAQKPAQKPAPKPATTSRPEPVRQVPQAAKDVGAPGAATAAAEAAVEEAVASDGLPTEPTRDELPISDFDNASLASLRARLRSLSLDQLAVLREYEQAHAHRLPIMTMLDNRIAKLAAETTVGEPAPAYPGEGGSGPVAAAGDRG